MTRRLVRVSEGVFEALEAALGAERGSHGEPSAHDSSIARGTLVRTLAAYGPLLDDDSIDLVSITIDQWPDEPQA